MAKVIIRKSGATIEAELSVAELKELAGLNGHTSRDHGGRETGQAPLPLDSNYKAFFNALSEQENAFCILSKLLVRKVSPLRMSQRNSDLRTDTH